MYNSIDNFHKIGIRLRYRKGFVDHFIDRHEISLVLDYPNTDWFKLGHEGLIHEYMMSETKKFLFDVSLNKVPLFINSFPELARWRLKIGK